MDIDVLVNRFEYYATNLLEISHIALDKKECAFFHIDLEEIQRAVTNGIKFPALYLQTPEVSKSGSYDSESESFDFTFVIVLKKGRNEKSTIFNQAKKLTDKIYNRIKADVTLGEIPGTIEGANEGAFGPITDLLYGWAVSIAISDGYDAEVNPKDWRDLS